MKILATAAAAALIASQTFAGTYEVRCETTAVPYQETVKGGEPEKVIGGAVIGGVIGKVVTDDNAGAAVGAVIGGVVGHENSKTTVTKYKDVETCKNVFIPDRVTDAETLEQVLQNLNDGQSVSKEMIMDVQYTIGVAYDGKWGPMSRRAAEEYLANLEPGAQPEAPLYSLVVNDVVIVSSADANAIDEIKKALFEAGVDSQIFVDLQ
ncbi:Glycine zipper 2TM domain-containing protein [Shimia gijangensis]|uniref:Glycine zipper 2TM domain-containing protein n=1 Tax=Shimia gijangensis TaxID=1470563 RepID=A0A1M6KAH3_9RHOB|nr:glycine zipper domain-containing protein [Shimia gijangensis]SHJ55887.1 Glycine zipper 2TM domain-containing protein [Shimia gijangensis]